MRKAMFWKKLPANNVQCLLCPNLCTIQQNKLSNCNARKNIDGALYSLTYGNPVSINVDPIEKKPLYHFLPGQSVFSIGTVGCNLHCKNCQNWETSQASPENFQSQLIEPEKIIEKIKQSNIRMIAYTYTEPAVFYEYAIEIAKLARKSKIKNILVSNGYINQTPLNRLLKYIDAANIDLKSMNPEFYINQCSGQLQPILETIKKIYKSKIWLEVTNLIISGLNDKEPEIKNLSAFISELSPKIPVHFSAFHPSFKQLYIPPTNPQILINARKLAKKAGILFAYTGNIHDIEGSTTFCHECSKPLITRVGYNIKEFNIEKKRCKFCKTYIPGVWE